MVIYIVVVFRDEQDHLPALLASLGRQTRTPDRLVLVDDGSVDGSADTAADFAARTSWATLLKLPVRPRERDRLVTAPEWRGFMTAVGQTDDGWDAIAKMDADLDLTPQTVATVERAFEADPRLGMAGVYISAPDRLGRITRERHPVFHVPGQTKFYRRECFEQIQPIPVVPGWESIDERKARMHGWTTRTFEVPSGDPVHLRRMGTLDGTLRGFRRDGRGAYAYGAHPLHVALGAGNRMRDWPWVLGSLNYVAGWAAAGVRRLPRAEPEVRRFARREQLRQIRGLVARSAS